jgi:threonine/homoserine/homoserine lactone efflux protein
MNLREPIPIFIPIPLSTAACESCLYIVSNENFKMTGLSVFSLFGVMLVLAAIPSASVALVVTRSAVHGLRNGAAVAAGIVLGDLVFATLAILGMTVLAEVLGGFFAIFKYLGGAYLIWMGASLLRTEKQVELRLSDSNSGALATSFLAGFFLTLGDLKAILFYASLFPAFVNLQSLSLPAFGTILLVTVVTVGGVKLAYAFAARAIIDRLRGRVGSKWIPKAAGGLMVGSGVVVIAKA